MAASKEGPAYSELWGQSFSPLEAQTYCPSPWQLLLYVSQTALGSLRVLRNGQVIARPSRDMGEVLELPDPRFFPL